MPYGHARKIKVLVVDDSALMRRQLSRLIERRAGFEVCLARDGQHALDQCRSEAPDVVTLDINMPVMDGLTCLSHLLAEMSIPVIMVSSLTDKGALATFEALELGAFDYVTKPEGTVSSNMETLGDTLIDKIRAAVTAIPVSHEPPAHVAAPASPGRPTDTTAARTHGFAKPPSRKLVVFGVSTGGPGTMEIILKALPGDFPVPIVIAQHMPARFTSVFAQRLNDSCALEVREIGAPIALTPGVAYLARGDADIRISQRRGTLTAKSVPSSDDYFWHPSVSRLVASACEAVSATGLIGVQLTGMGHDGAEEMARAYRDGALTIAETEHSAVVYGMPRALVEQGGATVQCDKHQVADQLIHWLS
ncbi:chemotaxis-specific protein-glutamate methyltransferase CheB [Salinisphaera sp. Q1T1-3]|uniref:chemotaxis-specific protein-glutamate methyltransferase CheB n=1 Tax=Salinisphaera sp. Q1T1-3 TaxID=2321229 RepID=UPI000E74D68D|nr:chemotaxis-specific protein-glutamate methyltransferase CheB [Salinisphaera sp. Q1T1-3]RJS91598.1 chemotaxis-specific protein-glutamate methyltransferase CheB [Salinisphaera sp. Q1T1-3]